MLKKTSILLLVAAIMFPVISVSNAVLAAQSKSAVKRHNQRQRVKTAAVRSAKRCVPAPVTVNDSSCGKVSMQMNGEIKVLAEATRGGTATPFVAVARDGETYSLLRAKFPRLPAVDLPSFKSHAIVAVFLGQRPTSGYSIDIRWTADGLAISELQPAPGSMQMQVLSSPFKVVSVAAEIGDIPAVLPIKLDTHLAQGISEYRVVSSDFAYTGGFVALQTRVALAGSIFVSRYEDFVTLTFNITSTGQNAGRTMRGLATGTLAAGGAMKFDFIDAGSLVEQPNPGMSATGRLTAQKLELVFEAKPATVSDGFVPAGKLTAVVAN